MNITEFAEQIVFGTSLDEKLQRPGRLRFGSSDKTSSQFQRINSPGRPAELAMQVDPGKTLQPPGDHQLENETARGQLLHFMANHELLATELMALVLLKFPEAPVAFRQGILVTLQEEQEHTRMYLRRMEECGVEFGSYPVSGQFWRIVEPMQSPMDFVSRLSLTFEQANLDYSLHFASVFRRLGDTATAALLQQIYEDEIGHVQHGLHWFRQWKDPTQTDFGAWQDALEFPMSPARGRGGPRSAFNREGRQRAGLDREFIDAVEVFGQSRDRAATVRWFDAGPEFEFECESQPSLATEKNLRDIEALSGDLEFAMLPLAKRDDLMLVQNLPSSALKKHWQQAGLPVPEFVLRRDAETLVARKLHAVDPWAWTPNNHDVADVLRDSLRHLPQRWQADVATLYRKSSGVAWLEKWRNEAAAVDFPDWPDWFVGPETHGICVRDESQLRAALCEFAGRGFETAVLKPDLSSSGRGQYRIKTNSQNVLSKRLRKPGSIAVVEPFLGKVLDLSFQWRLPQRGGEAEFLGWTRPQVSAGNRYAGTALGNPLAGCSPDVRQFLLANRHERLQYVGAWLEQRIVPELRERNFQGNFGVDAMLIRDRDNELKIRPLVELNPRTTMGHVALAVEKWIAPATIAQFRVLTRAEYLAQQSELESCEVQRSKDGKWRSGVIRLGEFSAASNLVPLVVVGAANLNRV